MERKGASAGNVAADRLASSLCHSELQKAVAEKETEGWKLYVDKKRGQEQQREDLLRKKARTK